MRKEILGLLEKGKVLHEQMISGYDKASSSSLNLDLNGILDIEVPGKINGMLIILNADAQSNKYKPINSLQQAIELFSNREIEDDINKALANKGLIGLSECEDSFISVQEIFEGTKSEIKSLIQAFNQHSGKRKPSNPKEINV